MSIKTIFIRNILKEEGRRLKSNHGRALSKELKFHSYRILRDREVDVLTTPSGGGTLRFTVPHYTRLLDIKKERRKKRGKGTSKRSLRIYNRFAMGAYYSIAQRVANDFTDEVARDIRMNYRSGGSNG